MNDSASNPRRGRGAAAGATTPASAQLTSVTAQIAPLAAALMDRYIVERELGQGGMATVYLARDVRHDRLVALKVLHAELGAVLGAERFLTEIRVTASLQHPHLLPLFDSGESNGLLWYTMPYMDGESLRARLEREKQLPVDEAVALAVAVARALDYAHAHGVVHRDLKPENILLQAGQPVVADFGIALAVSNAGGQRLTQTGLSLGTPQYMSPEQAMGDRAIDGRSDLYSLGAVLYEMLTGDPPHTASTGQAIVAKVLTEKARPVREARESVPVHVDAAVARMLEKLPADRFATARELVDALTNRVHVSGDRSGSGERDAAAPRRLRARSLPVVIGAVAAAALVITAAVTRSMAIRSTLARDPDLQLVRQVTFDGTARDVAISPDGGWIAYTATVCDASPSGPCRVGLEVREVDGTQSVRVGVWRGIQDVEWSPGGNDLLFEITGEDGKAAVMIAPRLGGTFRRVQATAPQAAAFTPDGRAVLVARAGEFVRYDVASLAVLDSIPVHWHGWVNRLSVGPRGTHMLAQLARTRADTGADLGATVAVLLLDGRANILDSLRRNGGYHSPQWEPDGRAIDVFSASSGGTTADVVRLPIRHDRFDRERMAVRLGQVAEYHGTGRIGVARTGRVAIIAAPSHWTAFSFRMGDTGSWRPLAVRTGHIEGLDVSPDDSLVAATMADNAGGNIYLVPVGGGEPRAVTSGAGHRDLVQFSPDGRQLAYLRWNGSTPGLWLVDANGGPERLLYPAVAVQPVWLGTDRVVVPVPGRFVIIDTTGKVLMRLAQPDSLALRSRSFSYPVAADPSTGRLAYWSTSSHALVVADPAKRTFRVLARLPYSLSPEVWTRDGTLISTRLGERDTSATLLERTSIETGVTTPITGLPRTPDCAPAASSRDGRVFVCDGLDAAQDVWVAEPRSRR